MAGSRNIIGIKNPVIDKLIDRLIYARGRDDLVAATKALDRVLLWKSLCRAAVEYPKVRTARWDRFGRPSRIAEIRPVGFSRRCGGSMPTGGRNGKRS
jgi:microcin C transport system substrate-binding protein